LGDCSLTQQFSAISWREQVILHPEDEVRFVLDQHTIFLGIAHLNTSSTVDMSLHSKTKY